MIKEGIKHYCNTDSEIEVNFDVVCYLTLSGKLSG